MRIVEVDGETIRRRLELADREDAEAADKALKDFHVEDPSFKSNLAVTKEYPRLLGFIHTEQILEGFRRQYTTIEEINARKERAGSALAHTALNRAATLESVAQPEVMAEEAIPDDALVNVIDLRRRQPREAESSPSDLSVA